MHALTFNPYRSMHADAFDCAPKFRSDRLPSLLFTALRWLLGAMPMALLRRRCRLYALYATRFTLYATNSRCMPQGSRCMPQDARCMRQTHVVCDKLTLYACCSSSRRSQRPTSDWRWGTSSAFESECRCSAHSWVLLGTWTHRASPGRHGLQWPSWFGASRF